MVGARLAAGLGIVLLALTQTTQAQSGGQSWTVFATGFEPSEGYSYEQDGLPLWGQLDWQGEGSGGNGILTNFFAGWGQQAYIGFSPPAPKDDRLNLWHPVHPPAPTAQRPIVKFEVLMRIADSTNGQYDDFRWSAYNSLTSRLFTVDFDNSRGEINYALDDNTGYHSTGFAFDNNTVYELTIWMNFWRNTWTALMNGVVVVESQPITTINARLDLADMDAVWAVRRQTFPGDNYMLFDDYRITSEALASIPPVLDTKGFNPQGSYQLTLHGERGLQYAIDVSSDGYTWETLSTFVTANGVWSLTDTSAKSFPMGIYRGRQVP